MVGKIAIALAVLFFTSLYSSSCSAIVITDDGFDVEVNFREKNDGLHVFGKIDGKRKCKQLNLTIFLGNSRYTGLFKVATSISNYDGGWPGPGKYKEVLDYPGEAKMGKWNVDHVETKCLN